MTSHNIITDGGWTITVDKIIVVLEFDENRNPAYQALEYFLKKISDTEFWFIDDSESDRNSYDGF